MNQFGIKSLLKSIHNNLKQRPNFRRYFANTSWLFGEKMLRMVVGLFVGVWVARYLGPEQFGLFSYAQSFVGLFTAIATLGLDGIIVRELVKDESKRDVLLGTAFWLKLIGAIGVLFGLAIAINFTSNDRYTNILVFIIASATIFQSFNVIDFYYQANVLSRYVVYANVMSLFLSSIIKIVLILYEAPLVTFAWTIVFDSVVLAVGFLYFYLHNHLSFRAWKFEKSVATSLLKDSWPLILSGIAISIYLKIGQVMIKEMQSAEQVGLYAAGAKLSEAWYFIPIAITSSVFPAIINAKKLSEALYYQRLQKLYYLMVVLALTIALPTTFLAPWLIRTLYGSAFLPSAGVLCIHIWTGVFVFLGVASGNWFLVENYINKNLYRTVLGMAINIVSNLILIPLYGIYGAAISALLGQLSADLLYDIFDKQTHPSLKMKIKALNPYNLFHYVYKKV